MLGNVIRSSADHEVFGLLGAIHLDAADYAQAIEFLSWSIDEGGQSDSLFGRLEATPGRMIGDYEAARLDFKIRPAESPPEFAVAEGPRRIPPLAQ